MSRTKMIAVHIEMSKALLSQKTSLTGEVRHMPRELGRNKTDAVR